MRKRLSTANRKRRQLWVGRFKWACVAAACLFVGVFGASSVEFLSRHMHILTETVAVKGNMRTPETDIQQAIFGQKRRSMALYSVAQARESLEKMPWVRAALVTKQWPNTLHVSLYEYTPLALMEQAKNLESPSRDALSMASKPLQKEVWVMAKSGDLIVPAAAAPSLRQLTEISGNPPLAAATHMVRQAGNAGVLLRQAAWQGNDKTGHWYIQTANQKAVLATPQNVARGLQTLQKLPSVAQLDIRVPKRLYIKKKDA